MATYCMSKQVMLGHFFLSQSLKTYLGKGIMTSIKGHFLISLGSCHEVSLVGNLTPGYVL